jgi:hypothetical protein
MVGSNGVLFVFLKYLLFATSDSYSTDSLNFSWVFLRIFISYRTVYVVKTSLSPQDVM